MKKKVTNQGISPSISTIISLSLVLFVIGLLSFVLINTSKVSNKMKESIVFSIMLKDIDHNNEMSNQKHIKEFQNYLKSSSYFKEVIFIHKDTATKKLQEDLGEEFSDILGGSPLLHSLDANVNAEFVSIEGLIKIQEYISNFKGGNIVHEVFYQESLVKKLESNVKKVSLFLLVICVIFFLISFTLINNTIRLAIYSKRLLIRTMRLVGATNMFIQKPYLIASIYQGLFSSIISLFMLIGVLELLKKQIPDFFESNDFLNISIIFGVILIFGVIISWMSTFFAVRRYLNLNENELYN